MERWKNVTFGNYWWSKKHSRSFILTQYWHRISQVLLFVNCPFQELRKNSKSNKLAQLRGMSLEGLVAGAQQKAAMFEKGQGIEQAAVHQGLTDK